MIWKGKRALGRHIFLATTEVLYNYIFPLFILPLQIKRFGFIPDILNFFAIKTLFSYPLLSCFVHTVKLKWLKWGFCTEPRDTKPKHKSYKKKYIQDRCITLVDQLKTFENILILIVILTHTNAYCTQLCKNSFK